VYAATLKYLNVDDAIAAVRKACRQFPSSRIVEHEALMAQLAGRAFARAQ
jgi:hypothetical protein